MVPVVGEHVEPPGRQGPTMQATLIVQRKRELHEVDMLLAKKRIDFKKRMEECAKKREELCVKVES